MARHIARQRVMQAKAETLADWQAADKRHRFVTRGELLYFLDLAYEAAEQKRKDGRWYRRLVRAVRAKLGAFGRGEPVAPPESAP